MLVERRALVVAPPSAPPESPRGEGGSEGKARKRAREEEAREAPAERCVAWAKGRRNVQPGQACRLGAAQGCLGAWGGLQLSPFPIA